MSEGYQNRRLNFYAVLFAAIAIILFFSGWFLERKVEQKNNLSHAAITAENNLRSLENSALALVDSAITLTESRTLFSLFASSDLSEKEISLLVYDNNDLTAWSGSDVTFVSIEKLLNDNRKLVHLPNGWYEMLVRKKNNRLVVSFILIHSDFAYQNKYLVNEFNPALKIPAGITISGDKAGESVHDREGNILFGIKHSEFSSYEDAGFPASETCDMLAIISLMIFSFFLGRRILFRSVIGTFLFILILLACRLAMIYFRFPGPLYNTSFFSPAYYAESLLFGSLGDLFLNVVLLFVVILIFFRHNRIIDYYSEKKFSGVAAIFQFSFWSLLIVCASVWVNYFASGLISNSKIILSLGNIFELNYLSITGFFILSLLIGFYALIFLLPAGLMQKSNLQPKGKTRIMVFAVTVFVFALLKYLEPPDWFSTYSITDFTILLLTAIFIEMYIIRRLWLPLPRTLIMLVIFSFYASALLIKFNTIKEHEDLKILSEKLEKEQDPIAEYLFDDVAQRIQNDTLIGWLLSENRTVQIAQRLEQVYFSGYWERYNTKVICYNEHGVITSAQPDSGLTTLYTHLSRDSGGVVLKQNASLPVNGIPDFSYAARLNVNNSNGKFVGAVIIFLREKLLPEENGFPELYISGNVEAKTERHDFSFARYRNGKLISAYGDFPYPFLSSHYPDGRKHTYLTEENDYEHLLYHASSSSLIIVSRIKQDFIGALTLFSYIFSFFSILVLVVYTVKSIAERKRPAEESLQHRVLISVMAIVLLSFLLTGWGTVGYIKNKYEQEQEASIRDKINDAIRAMENELPRENMFSNLLSDEKTQLLMRLSSILETDFNLYDVSGRVIFSSQPKLYQQGIISDRMNPVAMHEIAFVEKAQYVHLESIGRLNYSAAYQPVRDKNNEIAGYIGLPYFEKQTELKKEISSILGSLMNLYILLLAIALAAAYFISSRITEPLQILQEKFSSIRLGEVNKRIEWKRKDEIGSLVSEYNRMLEELTISADMIARSERESAWREMAKQVAHEIKNPLTPMKLSIQHLQRALNDNSPEAKALAEKTSQTLIEQIDSLSSIATAFSSFARMPQGQKEKINVKDVIQSVLNLYKDSTDARFVFSEQESDSCVVSSDSEELMRMFGNIIKNAIQSIPENKEGRIEVKIQKEINRCIVSIADNGRGIPDKLKSKIFSPNFTTKNTGMGLGLALAKSIAEGAGGEIWFETSEQSGTTFFVELPLSAESL